MNRPATEFRGGAGEFTRPRRDACADALAAGASLGDASVLTPSPSQGEGWGEGRGEREVQGQIAVQNVAETALAVQANVNRCLPLFVRLTPHPNTLRSEGRGDWNNRRAFTIIELLVVISIITLLISLLLPGISKSKENARRAVCAANSRSQVIAADNYSVENRGYLPPANSKDAAQKAWSFDLRDSFASAPKVPLGMGIPLALGYFHFSPEAFHCPSLDTASATTWNTPYHSMNTTIPNWWNSVGANWWNDPAYASKRITIGYTYRAASWWATHANDRFLQRERQPNNRVINADIIDPRFGRRYAHVQGYNYTRIDESGDWYVDPEGTLEQAVLGTGAIVVDGWGASATDEVVFGKLELGN